jgi:hypothetical protein
MSKVYSEKNEEKKLSNVPFSELQPNEVKFRSPIQNNFSRPIDDCEYQRLFLPFQI